MMGLAGWQGTVDSYLKSTARDVVDRLRTFVGEDLNLPIDRSQIDVWHATDSYLRRELSAFVDTIGSSARWKVVLEYALVRERGRRPDAIILDSGRIFVIEFKSRFGDLTAGADQVRAYARDLSCYHRDSHDRSVLPILALPDSIERHLCCHGIPVIGVDGLHTYLSAYASNPAGQEILLDEWLKAEYEPLPSLVHAARLIFANEALPQIRRAKSAGIPQALRALEALTVQAKQSATRHIAFITGVPGAGKTLVGLQFVYSSHIIQHLTDRPAVFLSGNGPLVKVLQHALKNSIFVRDVHGFLRSYGGHSTRTPSENIYIFDEAQRAWDTEAVQDKRGTPFSEPEDFVRIGGKVPDWAVLVALNRSGARNLSRRGRGNPTMEGRYFEIEPTLDRALFRKNSRDILRTRYRD
jgi:hypothetical protein